MKRYSENGLWVKKSENQYTVGLSLKGQDDLGDVSFVELLKQESVSNEDSFISVEAAKAVTELVSPLAGKVVAWHEELEENPEYLNKSEESLNWIMVLEDVQEKEFEQLLAEDLPIVCERICQQ